MKTLEITGPRLTTTPANNNIRVADKETNEWVCDCPGWGDAKEIVKRWNMYPELLQIALDLCTIPEYATAADVDRICDGLITKAAAAISKLEEHV